jgi:hypothetical protein
VDVPPGEEHPFDTGPGPSRAAFLIAYIGVVVAGLLGAAIGFGFVDAACGGDCALEKAIGTIVAGAGAAIGVGVVAVLTLRAMAEWRRTGPSEAPPGSPRAGGPRR